MSWYRFCFFLVIDCFISYEFVILFCFRVIMFFCLEILEFIIGSFGLGVLRVVCVILLFEVIFKFVSFLVKLFI